MDALLTVIVTWLAINFNLPASYEHPRVELAAPAKIAAILYRRLGAGSPPSGSAEITSQMLSQVRDVVALYDDTNRTILLHQGWTGTEPAEISVLVHEMVHHLQNMAQLKYECPQAREKPAYEAQGAWLSLFGRNLFDEFQTDWITLKLRTTCGMP
jgi:hypothetical protein